MTRGQPIRDLAELLRSLEPRRQPGTYAFCQPPPESDLSPAVAIVREAEGTTAIVLLDDAIRHGWAVRFRAAWITLTVESDLSGIGLTAAVTSLLAGAGIACNVIAGIHHDHLFVPEADGDRALTLLEGLSARHRRGESGPEP